MLLLFVQVTDGPPLLPDIYVRDTELSINKPVGCLQGWDDDYLQITSLSLAPMSFQSLQTLTAGQRSVFYWTRRLSKVLINGRFGDSGANAVIRIVYLDQNGVESIGPAITLNALTFQDGSNYIAELKEVETYGANKVAVEVISVSAGLFHLRLAGV